MDIQWRGKDHFSFRTSPKKGKCKVYAENDNRGDRRAQLGKSVTNRGNGHKYQITKTGEEEKGVCLSGPSGGRGKC